MSASSNTCATAKPELPVRGALLMLRAYRAVISPMLLGIYGPACRFEPSCSEYAHQAILEYGLVYGTLMAARRLARCRPLGGHGDDPNPARRGARRGD